MAKTITRPPATSDLYGSDHHRWDGLQPASLPAATLDQILDARWYPDNAHGLTDAPGGR